MPISLRRMRATLGHVSSDDILVEIAMFPLITFLHREYRIEISHNTAY